MKKPKHIETVMGVEVDRYAQLEQMYENLLRKYVDALHFFDKLETERDKLLNDVKWYQNIINSPYDFLEELDVKDIENFLRLKKLGKLNR